MLAGLRRSPAPASAHDVVESTQKRQLEITAASVGPVLALGSTTN